MLNEGDDENESIEHPHDEMEEIYPLQGVDCSGKMVKVTFIADAAGLYKLVFSNDHSWLRGKTLKVRYVVLTPVEPALEVDLPDSCKHLLDQEHFPQAYLE